MSEPYSLCAAVAVSTLAAAAAVSVAADDLVSRLAPCLGCHGENGKSELPEVPSLGAQNAPYTLIQLYLFREKQRARPADTGARSGDERHFALQSVHGSSGFVVAIIATFERGCPPRNSSPGDGPN